MQVFTMVTIITVSGIIAGLISTWIKHKKIPPVDLSPIEGRLKNLEKLQQRVETLEAIVTDKGYDLKREIDSLK